MKGFFYAATILLIFYCPAVLNTLAQQTESDRQNLSAIKIESFDWYAERDAPEPPKIKPYPPDGFPRGASANYPTENSSPTARSEKFIYRVKIRNLSAQTISSIVWRYNFVNPLTGETTASIEFESRVRIKPNKRKTLYAESVSLPAHTVDVRLLLLDPEQPFLESAEIKSVVYAENFESTNKQKQLFQ